MKRIFSMSLVLLMILTMLASCNDNDEPVDENTSESDYEVSTFETLDLPPTAYTLKEKYEALYATKTVRKQLLSGLNVERDISIKSSDIKEEGVLENIEYAYQNCVYKLKYAITSDDGLFNGAYRYYEYAGAVGQAAQGKLDLAYDKAGNAVSLLMRYSDIMRPEPNSPHKLVEFGCENIARKILSELTDAENYVDVQRYYNEGTESYGFVIMRKIGNLETMEKVMVEIDVYGNMLYYSKIHVGDMKGVPEVPDEILQMALSAVFDDIKEKYDTVKSKVTYEVRESEAEYRLIRLADGRVALEVSFGVDVTEISTGKTDTENQKYIVPLE